MRNCSGLHCGGCGKGGRAGGGIALAVVVVLAVIAANGRAISRTAAEVGHVLVLAAIAGASLAGAALAVTLGLAVRRRLTRAEPVRGRVRATVAAHPVRELPEPRAALPEARADMPAQVWIHPPREVECPYPSCHHNVPDEMLPVRRRPAGGHR